MRWQLIMLISSVTAVDIMSLLANASNSIVLSVESTISASTAFLTTRTKMIIRAQILMERVIAKKTKAMVQTKMKGIKEANQRLARAIKNKETRYRVYIAGVKRPWLICKYFPSIFWHFSFLVVLKLSNSLVFLHRVLDR